MHEVRSVPTDNNMLCIDLVTESIAKSCARDGEKIVLRRMFSGQVVVKSLVKSPQARLPARPGQVDTKPQSILGSGSVSVSCHRPSR